MPQRRGFCGFLAKAVTPSPHVQASPWAQTTKSKYKAQHAQTVTIKLIFIRPQILGMRTHDQAARPLQSFFARGVTPASFPASAILFCHIIHFEIHYCISGPRQHHHLSPSTFILIFQSFS